MAEPDLAKKILVFDRTPIARLISCAAAFGSGAFLFDYLARGVDNIRPLPLAGLILLVLGTVAAALLQYGDHIYLSPEGLLYDNRWFHLFGKGGSWLRWDEIVEVREVKRKILILLSEDGRRILVDAIVGYAIARREILKRTPHAVISGTLTREDRA